MLSFQVVPLTAQLAAGRKVSAALRPRKRQVGRALTILAQAEANEHIYHADVAAFYAPSECHTLVRKGEEARFNKAWTRAYRVAGVSRKELRAAYRALGGQRWDRLVEACLDRSGYPF